MIRIPRYWTYFISAIICIGIAFQSDSRLFYFIGVSTSFNFLARIGLLVWVVWLFLLGTRGHVIFWSTYRVSYADFYGGYKILWIFFGLGSFLLFLGSLTSFSQVSFFPPPLNLWKGAKFAFMAQWIAFTARMKHLLASNSVLSRTPFSFMM